jgi:hypothetical protein
MRAGDAEGRPDAARGVAVLTVVLVMTLASSLALALVLITTIDTRAAFNFRGASEALFAADAGIELALPDLAGTADWSAVLDGSAGSTFVDGAGGARTLADGRSLDLVEVVNQVTCGHAAACTPAEMDAITESRPWGPNNPRWRLYMNGTLGSLASGQVVRSSCYLVVLVADDPSETDGNPLRDGVAGQNPGAGVLLVRSEAFGPGGAHKVIEATVARPGGQAGLAAGVRMVAWREVREPGF